jgi:serine/threonine protein phosphatase PrpC
LAVTAALRAAGETPPEKLLKPSRWEKIGTAADMAVDKAPDAGYTSLIALGCSNNEIAGVCCGDSAAYVVSNGHMHVLTERQLKNPPIGSGVAAITSFNRSVLSPWYVVLVSDGAWKYIGWDAMGQISKASEPGKLTENLLNAMRAKWQRGFPDDFSVLVVSNG